MEKKNIMGKLYGEGGVVRQGKEAVEVWRRYFERELNKGDSSEIQGRGGERESGSENFH